MLVTEAGAALCTLALARQVCGGHLPGFDLQVTLWLWFTVLFANIAEALAEGRGKAQAESLRRARVQTLARQRVNGTEVQVPASQLRRGDLVICAAGERPTTTGSWRPRLAARA